MEREYEEAPNQPTMVKQSQKEVTYMVNEEDDDDEDSTREQTVTR